MDNERLESTVAADQPASSAYSERASHTGNAVRTVKPCTDLTNPQATNNRLALFARPRQRTLQKPKRPSAAGWWRLNAHSVIGCCRARACIGVGWAACRAFGGRRSSSASRADVTTHGFTGHEMLDAAGFADALA